MGFKKKGLLFELVTSARKWFPNDIARFNFYLEVITETEKENWELCQVEATEADPVFERALLQLHPELK
jgi:hypothetical protein